MDQHTHDIRLTRWASLIKECSESGLTKTAWCAQNDVSIKSFYYWQRRLRTIAVGNADLLPVTSKRLKRNTIIEVPMATESISSSAPVTLHVNGVSVDINNDATPELLNMILKVITHAQ